MSRDEPTLVEQLITEKAELERFIGSLESYRRNIRLGDQIAIEPSVPSRLRRMFFRGVGLAGDGVPNVIPPAVVTEFYRFTIDKTDAAGDRLNQINAELAARSKES